MLALICSLKKNEECKPVKEQLLSPCCFFLISLCVVAAGPDPLAVFTEISSENEKGGERG